MQARRGPTGHAIEPRRPGSAARLRHATRAQAHVKLTSQFGGSLRRADALRPASLSPALPSQGQRSCLGGPPALSNQKMGRPYRRIRLRDAYNACRSRARREKEGREKTVYRRPYREAAKTSPISPPSSEKANQGRPISSIRQAAIGCAHLISRPVSSRVLFSNAPRPAATATRCCCRSGRPRAG